eukprot:7532104-Lingulodinium_polyedra.AAC.1
MLQSVIEQALRQGDPAGLLTEGDIASLAASVAVASKRTLLLACPRQRCPACGQGAVVLRKAAEAT